MMAPAILLVEDSALDEELMVRAVRGSKVPGEVIVTRDGAEALDYLFATGPHAGRDHRLPQVVLLDLNLPKLGGLDVLQRIRADDRTKLLVVVMLTSSNETRDIIASYAERANGYVVKPADFLELCATLRTVLQYWVVLNIPAPAVTAASPWES